MPLSHGIYPAQAANPPPAIDGAVSGALQAGGGATLSLTTTQSNDVIIAIAAGNSQPSSVSGGGLTWNFRNVVNQPSGNWWVTLWWAIAAAPLNNASISFVWTSSNAPYVFGVSGANNTTPFDPLSSLPVLGTSDPSTFSTSVPNDLVIACVSDGVANPALPSGFIDIARRTGTFSRLCYQAFGSTQSGVSVPFGINANAAVYIDALQHA